MADHDLTQRTQLSDLVRSRRAELRLSLRSLSAACVDPENPENGSIIGYNYIDRLEKNADVKAPKIPELRALANGLGVPLAAIQDAAGAQFMGITPQYITSGEARALVTYAEGMTDAERRQLLAIVEAYNRSRTQ
ncbi:MULTISPECIES: hypothetical protein [Streptomyces]|jgi:transcriptional regulator with XRE-family HTH domain|uniref:XRE family transcriptional regulator n=1 Tax=Streptomyces doudnae TaxID=3075536 RepID=A0ABD5EW86_9ACTN|nr:MULTISPECIES: hypothetical protein [unclassified Streptomyces]MDT0438600.1 XRE family transcriptional regulator [Streptomyces sp. DSM 41981]MYQ65759.1 XRE family transcriptional regulator [Streptomyces sp. SID4950]SCE07096.1 hypothetical protein GA0115242_121422 [Streptomyces sp. SolWspMP-5a-2]